MSSVSFANLMPLSASLPSYRVECSKLAAPTVEQATQILRDLFALNPQLSFSNSEALKRPTENRYPDVFPYDDNRYCPYPAFYYNASPMVFGNHKYIAAQGPLDAQVECFWEMVKASRSEVIVTVTDSWERTGPKCSPYWESEMMPDHLKLNLEETMQQSEAQKIVIRLFTDTKDKNRIITQIHYMGWPDKAAPNDQMLYMLIDLIDKHHKNLDVPIVVHCSAGVGRTGVVIAAHSLKHDIKMKPEAVNIPERILTMRRFRRYMVQMPDQVIAIYRSVILHAKKEQEQA